MFGSLKEVLGGERFNDDAVVEQYVRNWSALLLFLMKGSRSYLSGEKMHFR